MAGYKITKKDAYYTYEAPGHKECKLCRLHDPQDIAGLLKAMDVKYEEIEESLLEHLIRYIKLVVELLGVKLIIFVNLRSYLSDRQFRGLIQEIKYQEIKALFIENQEKACIEGGMRYIIDKDGCEIY